MGDFGYREWVCMSELRTIDSRFMRPWFSGRSHLTGIYSSSASGEWTQPACEAVHGIICGKQLYMHVKVSIKINAN